MEFYREMTVLDSGLLCFLTGPKLLFRFSRDWLSPSLRVWRVPASHLRPLPDESQRFLMARGVFAVHCVSTAPHHQLLLQRKETLLQTRLPTVSTISCCSCLHFFRLLWLLCSDVKQNKNHPITTWFIWITWRPCGSFTLQKCNVKSYYYFTRCNGVKQNKRSTNMEVWYK